jgi:ERCC4-type nuclease
VERKPYHFKAELSPADVLVTVEDREHIPLDLNPLQTVSGHLKTSDYGLTHLPHECAVEWKAGTDLITSLTHGRDRLDGEVTRMLAYPCRCLVTDWTWERIEAGDWRNDVSPKAIIGSLLGIQARGVPVIMAGSRERAGQLVARFLYIAAARKWREVRGLASAIVPDLGAVA